MAKIKNMGTATMRFNEGIVVSGSIDTSYASQNGVAIVCTGSLEIAANSTNNQVIRIISKDSQREMVFDSFVTSGGGSGTAAQLLGNGSKGLRIDASNLPTNGLFFTINTGTDFKFQFFSSSPINTPVSTGQINILIDSDPATLVNRIIAAINGDTSIGNNVKWVSDNASNRPTSITASANGSFTNGITLTSNTTGTGGNSFYLNTNTNKLSVIQNSNQLFQGGSTSGGGSTTQETVASIFSEIDHDLVISGSKEVHIRSGDGKAVMILSGTSGGASSPNPSNFTDTNLFVSGAIDSMGTAVKGTSVFGGDLHVSGAAQINSVTVLSNGRVGIGTTSPLSTLDVRGTGARIVTTDSTADLQHFRVASNGDLATGTELGRVTMGGSEDGSNFYFGAAIVAKTTEAWNPGTAEGTELNFWTTPNSGNTLTKRMIISNDGTVNIGSGTPNELLTVEGAVSLKEQASIPSHTSNYGKLYTKSSDGSLYFKNDSGSEYNLLGTNTVWQGDGTNVYLADSNDKVGIGTTSPDTKMEIVYTGQPQSDLSDRANYHLLLTHVMGNHDTSFDNSIGIGFNVRESTDADEIGAAIVHVQSGSHDVGNLSFYVKGKTQDQADPSLVMIMSASIDDRGGRVSINPPPALHDTRWPLEVTNYAGNASAGAKTCLRLTGELDNTGVSNFGSGPRMRLAVRENGDETRDIAGISAVQDAATTAGKLQFETTNMGSSNPTTKMTISQEGFVGIGIDNPDTPLHLQSTSGAAGGLLRLHSIFSTIYWDIFIGNPNGNTLYFKYNGGDNGGYLDASADVENINFTGQHRASPVTGVASDYKEKIGMIVVSSGDYNNLSDTDKKPTISESVPAVLVSSQRNQKSAFGVIADIELESESERKFAQGAFVTTFSKPGNDERLIINSLGEGAIWVCSVNGSLENGDYITTCEIPGLGMRQDDDILHNYTVAKVTQDCDFDTASSKYETIVFTHNGIEYKKSFVGCTYHCG